MNRIAASLLLLTLLLSALVGCNSTRTDTFDIELHNATNGPLTLSLAKDGPPFEPSWATPQDLAIETPKRREEWSGGPSGMTAIPAGKTATVTGLKGQFNAGTKGYIRAYVGELTISEMLAREPDSPNRIDVPLKPGVNRIRIIEKSGHLAAEVE